MGDSRTVHHSSHWGAFDAEVRDGRLVGVRPFAHDTNPSPIIRSLPDMVHGESRVMQPMIRKGWLDHGPGGARERRGADPFVPVSWEKAVELVAAELERVRAAHGNEAIFGGSYGWSSAGRFHHAKTQLQRFLVRFGGFTGQLHNYSYAAGLALLPHLVGTTDAVAGPVTDWTTIESHCRLMVCFGGLPLKNTQVDSGGAGQHSAPEWIARCRRAGVRFVNISPIRDDAPDGAEAEWIAPRPNTDTALMLGMAHVLYAEGLHDAAFLERWCTGFDRFLTYLTGAADGQAKTPEWAADICGVPAETIRRLARDMATNRTMISMAWSLQRGDHGEQPYWMAIVLASMLGQIGLPGGGFGFGYGCVGGMGNPRRRVASPNLPTGANPIDSWIPVARISDMLLNPGASYDFNGETRTYPDIRLVYWCGGNPFHHHQDLNRLVEAFRRPDTIIFHEPWWTSSARHADIVLPATTTLERNDIGSSSRDRYVLAMQQAVEPVGQARADFDIFADLAGRLGFRESFTEGRDEMQWLRHLYDVSRQLAARQKVAMPDFDAFWAAGHLEIPMPDAPYVMFSDFRANPEAAPLRTPSGKIEIYSERIAGFGYDDCPGHPMWLPPVEWQGAPLAAEYPLHMLSNQPRTRLHSQLDGAGVAKESKIQGREPVWIHPDDAAARGIADGDVVRLFNGRGAVLAGAVVTDLVRPGVLQLPTGAWYDPLEPGCLGTLDKHGNANTLTLDKGTSRLGQGPIAQSALVEAERWTAALPEITVFSQPKTAA